MYAEGGVPLPPDPLRRAEPPSGPGKRGVGSLQGLGGGLVLRRVDPQIAPGKSRAFSPENVTSEIAIHLVIIKK